MRHTERDIGQVLHTLYEGVTDEEAWRRALPAMADLVGGSAVVLFCCNPADGQVYRADLARIDPKVMQEYGSTWIHRDARHAASLTCAVGVPQIDGMVMNVRDFHRTAAFNEFFLPADIPFHVATWVERTPRRGVVLSIQGTWARGAFTEEERQRLTVLIPHLRRAVNMKDRLAHAQVQAGSLLQVMERLPFGVLLLGANMEILEASAKARALLAAKTELHDEGGRLGFLRSVDRRAFARRLREDPFSAQLEDAIRIARASGRQALSLVALPLAPTQEMWMAPAARWLVMIIDPETTAAPNAVALQRIYGLTGAEAVLTQRLVAGATLIQAATALDVSLNTVRSQLKAIFAKTGVRTQAQLVSRILGSTHIGL